MRFVNLRGRRLTKRCSHTRSAWGGGRREGRVERMSQGTAVCFRRESSACHFFALVSIEAVVSMGKESVWWRLPERVEWSMPLLDQLNGGLWCEQPRIVMDTCSDLCMAKKSLCDMLSGATMKNSETTVPHGRHFQASQGGHELVSDRSSSIDFIIRKVFREWMHSFKLTVVVCEEGVDAPEHQFPM
jgi:hypothetical protein